MPDQGEDCIVEEWGNCYSGRLFNVLYICLALKAIEVAVYTLIMVHFLYSRVEMNSNGLAVIPLNRGICKAWKYIRKAIENIFRCYCQYNTIGIHIRSFFYISYQERKITFQAKLEIVSRTV